MKEMCRNFLCNNNNCSAAAAGNSSSSAAAAAIPPETSTGSSSMGDCNTCVLNRIGLAQAYIPDQSYEQPKEQEEALVCGTAFSELSMPYCSGWNLYRFQKEA